MKRSHFTTVSAMALAIGVLLAYGMRWFYVSVLIEDAAWTVFCGTIVAIGLVLALIGACGGVAAGMLDMKEPRKRAENEMNRLTNTSHWISRIVGGVVVAAGVFLSLCIWDTWELSMPIRIGVAIVCGIMFLCFGGNVWRWIDGIDDWT